MIGCDGQRPIKSSSKASELEIENKGHEPRNVVNEAHEPLSVVSVPKVDKIEPKDAQERVEVTNDQMDVHFGEQEISPDIITVCQLRSSSMLRVPITVNGRDMAAVVDTAAEVTIISDSVYRSLPVKPNSLKSIKLHTAGKDMSMIGFVVGPVTVELGNQCFQELIYVAPIEDDMLLGINFMSKHGINLDLKDSILTLGSNKIKMTTSSKNKNPTVAKVCVDKKVVIPPNSMMHVSCSVDDVLEQYMVEPRLNQRVIIPRTIHQSYQDRPQVCVLNLSDCRVKLKKGFHIGQASTVSTVHPVPDNLQENLGSSNTGSTEPIKQGELPAHLSEMYEKSSQTLTQEQKVKFKELLLKFQNVFAKTDFDLGNFTAIEHTIDTGDAKPVKLPMRRTPSCFVQEEENHLKKMIDAQVIRPSSSSWASCPVLIRKRDGSVRYCLDFRALNNVTIKDTFPLPIIEEALDSLTGNVWFSKLDANSAYWQIPIAEEDIKKTAFTTKYGLYEFQKLAFGLCNAPSTFARVINLVLRGLNWNVVLAFLDDILVLGKTFEDHLFNLSQVLDRLDQYQLKLKPRKCDFFQEKVQFLGRTVSAQGLEMGETPAKVVLDWERPPNIKEVERFLGYANYHRGFIKDFAKLAVPLYKVTQKGQPFVWGDDQEQAFNDIKSAFTKPPMLALPNSDGRFILDTDASDYAIGAELSQEQDGVERVIAFGSYGLSSEQLNYCTTRKELLAIVRFTRQFRHHLLGRPFLVRTDHSSLTWLLRFKHPQGQLARWLEELSQYDMTVQHRRGDQHLNADFWSRLGEKPDCHEYKLGFDLDSLPCGGCQYCTRAHNVWAKFAKEVDDVQPLAKGQFHISQVKCNDNFPDCPLYAQNNDLFDVFSDFEINGLDSLFSVAAVGSVEPVQKVEEQPRISHLEVSAGDWSECGGLDSPTRPTDSIQHAAEKRNVQVKLVGSDSVSQTFWGHDREQLIKSQTEDPNLKVILDWLKNQIEPSQSCLMAASKAIKYYWINKDLFFLEDNVLWRKSLDNEEWLLVVPESLKKAILELNHDLPSAGHQGQDRTKQRISTKYFWFEMGADVRHYVTSCPVCNQFKKPNRKNKSPLTIYQAGAPLEKVHIDFIGPFPKTRRDCTSILMIVDNFTKWVECIALPSQDAETTACALVNEFFSRFGYPFEIFSDQGRNFQSDLFTKLCELLKIHKSRTVPYRASGNGQAERTNRTLLDAVRCFVQKSPDNWDLYLPQIAGALRSSVNRQTGYTPNRLMLGRETNQVSDLIYRPPNSENTSADDYLVKLEKAISLAHQLARDKLKSSTKIMKRDHDIHVLQKSFAVGDLVYILCTDANKGKGKKLMPQWKGPGMIVKKFTDTVYRIKLRNSIITGHHDKLKICKDRTLPDWLQRYKRGFVDTQQPLNHSGRVDVYCFCRKPYDGSFMIQCDGCAEWYHGRCVNLTPSDAVAIDKYTCKKCE